jgi:hypothetical protein
MPLCLVAITILYQKTYIILNTCVSSSYALQYVVSVSVETILYAGVGDTMNPLVLALSGADPKLVDAASSSPTLTVIVISTLCLVAVILGGILWWFIRDRMKAVDARMKEKEEEREKRDAERAKDREKRETERQRLQEALDKERHTAVVNLYASIEKRLQGGSETFREMSNSIKEANKNHAAALRALEDRLEESSAAWTKSADTLQKSFLEAQLKFVSKSEFDRFRGQREEERKKRDTEFSRLQDSQDNVIKEMRELRVSFESAVKTINAAVGRLMDQKLAEADCEPENTTP